MSGKNECLFIVEDVAKDRDLPGEVLKFDVTNLEKYFGKESWHILMINSRIWATKFKNQKKKKPNKGRTTRYSDNKTIMGN